MEMFSNTTRTNISMSYNHKKFCYQNHINISQLVREEVDDIIERGERITKKELFNRIEKLVQKINEMQDFIDGEGLTDAFLKSREIKKEVSPAEDATMRAEEEIEEYFKNV